MADAKEKCFFDAYNAAMRAADSAIRKSDSTARRVFCQDRMASLKRKKLCPDAAYEYFVNRCYQQLVKRSSKGEKLCLLLNTIARQWKK